MDRAAASGAVDRGSTPRGDTVKLAHVASAPKRERVYFSEGFLWYNTVRFKGLL